MLKVSKRRWKTMKRTNRNPLPALRQGQSQTLVGMADLVEWVMVDFDMIMEMDRLHSCYGKIDCRTRTRTIRFEFSNESVIEWRG